MNKVLSIIFLLIFFQSAKSQYKYTLNLNSDPIFNNKEFGLIIENSEIMNREVVKASAKILNSKSEFTGTMQEVSKKAILTMVLNGRIYKTTFVLDTGINSIRVDSIDNYKRSLALKPPTTPSNNLKQQIDSLTYNAYRAQRKETNNFTGSLMLDLNNSIKLDKQIFNALNKYGDLYYSLIVLNDKSRNFEMIRQDSLLLSIFKNFDEKIKTTSIGKIFYEQRISNLLKYRGLNLKKELSNFTVDMVNGGKFKTSKMRGTPYLIVFSAIWCLPCLKEIPKLKELYKKFHSSGFEIVYFNMDDDKDKWIKSIKVNDLIWINVSEGLKFRNSIIRQQFLINTLPSSILVDKDGKIANLAIDEGIDFKEINNLLEKYSSL